MITIVKHQLTKVKIVLFVVFSVLRGNPDGFGMDLLAGCILSVTNAFLGYVFIERAFRLNGNLFMIFSLAGMTMRFFLMIAAVAVFLLTTTVNTLEFVGSFMAFYTVFLVAEILHINKKTDLIKLRAAVAQ
jgi:hypothetical protein